MDSISARMDTASKINDLQQLPTVFGRAQARSVDLSVARCASSSPPRYYAKTDIDNITVTTLLRTTSAGARIVQATPHVNGGLWPMNETARAVEGSGH